MTKAKKHFFITGTDTGVGKTIATGLLAKHYSQGQTVITQKWVQTGCTASIPEDIQTHWDIMAIRDNRYHRHLPLICPYQFPYPASPHLAAQKAQSTIVPSRIYDAYHQLTNLFDCVFCEGAGGILVPLNQTVFMIDMVKTLSLSVIIVIANKLGCINHALMTINTLKHHHISIEGLVFNHTNTQTPAHIIQDNKTIICHHSQLPCLLDIPFCENNRYTGSFNTRL